MGSFLIFILILSVILLIGKRNNFYAIVFAISFLGMEALFLVILMSAGKFAHFSYQSRLEYQIYHMVISSKANYYDLKRIANFSVCMVLCMMLLIAWKNDLRINRRRVSLLYGGVFFFMIAWILFLDSIRVQDILYIAYYSGYGWAAYVKAGIQQGEKLLITGLCVLPVWRLGIQAVRTRLRARKKYLYGVMLATVVLAGIFLCIVYNMPIRFFLWEYEANNFKKLYGFYKNSIMVSKLIWPFLFGAVVCILFLLIRFEILQENSFMRKQKNPDMRISIEELRHVFHSYKNLLFSMKCMCNTALEKYGQPEGEEALRAMLHCIDGGYGQVSRFLNIYNRADLKWTRFLLQEVVAEARRRMGMLEDIMFLTETFTEDDFVYGDFGELTDLFVNLFTNSVDAIHSKYEPLLGKSGKEKREGEQQKEEKSKKEQQREIKREEYCKEEKRKKEQQEKMRNRAYRKEETRKQERKSTVCKKEGYKEENNKENNEGGKIKVTVWVENTLVCVSVWDNGIGMDKKTRKTLYTPFYTTKKTMNNWGIGMSQIKKTIEAHQGFIDVDSKYGEYTEFQIALSLDR